MFRGDGSPIIMFVVIDQDGDNLSEEFESYHEASSWLSDVGIYNTVANRMARATDPDEAEEEAEEEVKEETEGEFGGRE